MRDINIVPVPDRMIVMPIAEENTIGMVAYEFARKQMWRGYVLEIGSDVSFAKKGDIIRFQPMKLRYDSFKWLGSDLIFLEERWVYLIEDERGSPIKVNTDKIICEMLSEEWEKTLVFDKKEKGDYSRARVVQVANNVKEVKTGDIVLVEQSEWWQYWRNNERWLFVTDMVNCLGVEEC